MRGRAAAAALPALVILALVAVVAIAAGGSTSSGSDTTRRPSESLLDAFFTLGLVAIGAGGLLLLYGLTQRKAIAQQAATGKYRASWLGWVVLAGVYVVVWYFRPKDFIMDAEESDLLLPDNGVTPQTPDTQNAAPYEARISWPALVLVAVLLASGVAAYVSSGRRRRRVEPDARKLAEQLAAALDEGLDDLRAEPDPRRAIIAAYARLERTLAAGGVPRRPAETAQEYVPRVLGALALDSRPIERLTALFTQAKFSLHEVDTRMKDEAIAALEEVRRSLEATERERLAAERLVTVGAAS